MPAAVVMALVLAGSLAGCSRSAPMPTSSAAPLGPLAVAAPSPAPAAAPTATSKGTCGAVAECAQGCAGPSLESCVQRCEQQLNDQGRPLYRALRACSIGHCETACKTPTDFGCKACVMASCAAEATSCLAN